MQEIQLRGNANSQFIDYLEKRVRRDGSDDYYFEISSLRENAGPDTISENMSPNQQQP